jgi:lysophospholipid acyltransferase (LPLAT)-like uncharacterized protein
MADPAAAPPVPRSKRSGIVVPHQAVWHQRWAAALMHGAIQAVAATLRYRLDDETGFFRGHAPPEPVIFCIWHNRLALCLVLYRRYVRRFQPGRRLAAMVSASRDGAFLSRILEWSGVEPVRGSTSRRGPQALRELVTWGERGCDLAITPDGPRGPRYTVQEGVVSVAQLTGMPIVPVAYHLSWKKPLRSWDRFQVPLPFAVCSIRVGEALRVPRDASDAERETLRRQLEERLRAITQD